jgi:two-component system response regulator HydG
LPPLRERREDIPLLVEFFLDKHNKKLGRKVQLADGVMDALMAYPFRGNVREVENLVEQAVALSAGGIITLDDILPDAPKSARAGSGHTLADIVDEAERNAVEAALRAHDGSRERAAEALSISATTLWRKMTRLGIATEAR